MRVIITPALKGWRHYVQEGSEPAIGPVVLHREPDNVHDRNAVGVHQDGCLIGHLPADVAAVIAPLMDQDHTFTAKVFRRDTGKVRCDWGEYIPWVKYILHVKSDDLSDAKAQGLCVLFDVEAFYEAEPGQFLPAQRTKAGWKRKGRNVRRRARPTIVFDLLFPVTCLTCPAGAELWPK